MVWISWRVSSVRFMFMCLISSSVLIDERLSLGLPSRVNSSSSSSCSVSIAGARTGSTSVSTIALLVNTGFFSFFWANEQRMYARATCEMKLAVLLAAHHLIAVPRTLTLFELHW